MDSLAISVKPLHFRKIRRWQSAMGARVHHHSPRTVLLGRLIAVIGIAGLLAATSSRAGADSLDRFAAYGSDGVTVGRDVSILHGALGGGTAGVSATSGLAARSGVFSGGGFAEGGGSTLGPVVADGSVALGYAIPGTAVNGNVRSAGGIFLGDGTIVTGDAIYGTTITYPAGSVLGTVIHDGTSGTFVPHSLTPFLKTAGGADVAASDGQVLDLAPGSYGNVALAGNNVLHLASGDYLFQSLFAGDHLIVEIDLDPARDPVTVFVQDGTSLGTATVQLTGGTFSDVHWEAGGDWAMSGAVDWLGSIVAPKGDIVVSGDNSRFQGALNGKTIFLADGTTVSIIPEPLTIAGFVVSAAAVLRHIRKKARTRSMGC